jgi:hypothetical protein
MIIKKIILTTLFILTIVAVNAQKVDSIYFHLYTDSLKKGTHNYINVDGKLSNGKWKPLTEKEISFTSSYGIFEGNELILPPECKVEKVIVKAVLKDQPGIWKETTIWIKKKTDDEKLPTKEEVMKGKKSGKKN